VLFEIKVEGAARQVSASEVVAKEMKHQVRRSVGTLLKLGGRLEGISSQRIAVTLARVNRDG